MKQNENSMFRNIVNLFLIAIVSLVLYLVYRLLSPFLACIFVAVILGLIFYPLYRWLLVRTRDRKRLSSLITCVVITLCIVVPVSLMIGMLTTQSFELYRTIESKIADGSIEELLDFSGNGTVDTLVGKAVGYFDIDTRELVIEVSKGLQSISGSIFSAGTGLVKNLSSLVVNFLLMIFALYYIFIEGERVRDELIHVSPLSTRYEKRILDHFHQVASASVKGSILTALAQGVAGGIGFAVVGLPSAALWGSVMAFFALIPMVGTAIVWIPASIYLLATGHWVGGIALILWGALLVGMIDNLLKPVLIKSQTSMHPLLIFFSILGGLQAFGFLGIVIGPTILALFLTMLEIYREEFREDLETQDG